jgi:hypothetical protein
MEAVCLLRNFGNHLPDHPEDKTLKIIVYFGLLSDTTSRNPTYVNMFLSVFYLFFLKHELEMYLLNFN